MIEIRYREDVCRLINCKHANLNNWGYTICNSGIFTSCKQSKYLFKLFYQSEIVRKILNIKIY